MNMAINVSIFQPYKLQTAKNYAFLLRHSDQIECCKYFKTIPLTIL